ncbi:class I SAM-dependent DNA methyltransferase [Salisediminibacterium beveridgei]|uniref:Tellurite resistance protein-related protein n=1 Tax=Salisediminibacterium beveridgei TaxID=632773 RepID=A0A1D7QVP3_9BACI|nr:class I SAM-dependent methyltransferase [Salisediminibacterium beveridgei]AOM83080.1 Tellurite resistance protein-related protein [Salisediminibacterium beveridgei]
MRKIDQPSVTYYDLHANAFDEDTGEVSITELHQLFLKYLKPGARILDLGCGSGRDSLAFMNSGYHVTAMDGSEEMCKIASAKTGLSIEHRLFHQLSEKERFDGIWACASLLHVPMEELPDLFDKIRDALKSGGCFYSSYKYGSFEGIRNDRYFTDMDEDRAGSLLEQIGNFKLLEMTTTSDVRQGRSEEKWLNLLLKKE